MCGYVCIQCGRCGKVKGGMPQRELRCLSCRTMIPAGESVCPNCGFSLAKPGQKSSVTKL